MHLVLTLTIMCIIILKQIAFMHKNIVGEIFYENIS